MAKSAQQKFNEYLDECKETNDAVNSMVEASYDNHKTYAWAAGALSSILKDAISELPRGKREEFRRRMIEMAGKQQQEILLKTLKAA